MKKIVILMVLLLVGCQSDILDNKEIKSKWYGYDFVFEFKDGQVAARSEGKTIRGPYEVDGNNVTMTFDKEVVTATYDKNTLSFDEQKQARLKMTHAKIEREYLVYQPEQLDSKALVMVLHGFGGQVEGLSYMGFDKVADDHGFLVCYPQAMIGNEKKAAYWNANFEEGQDDMGYLVSLASKLVKDYDLDKDKVYLAGYSNGGFMAYTVALNAPDTFKKVAVVAGLMSHEDWQNKESAKPLDILHIHGLEDDVIEYKDSSNYLMGVEDIMSFWAGINEAKDMSVNFLGDNTLVRTYEGQKKVSLYSLKKYGHEWPTKEWTDIDGAEVIWHFFEDY